MLKFKSKWAKRMLAFVLSGAMVLTSMTSSALTANAAEDTGEGYSYDIVAEDSDDDGKEAEIVSDAKDEEGNEVIAEATKEETKETTVADDENQAAADDQDDSDNQDDADSDDSDSAKEDVVADEDETTVVEEEEVKDEDVKADFTAIPAGTTVRVALDSTNLSCPSSGSTTFAEDTIVGEEGYFCVLSGVKTNDTSKTATFYEFSESKGNVKASDIGTAGGRVQLSNKEKAVKFQTSEAVDVTLFWSAGAAGSDRQVKIVKDIDNGGVEQVAITDEATAATQIYVSTVTIEDAGTYYIGGNEYLFGVQVAPKAQKSTRTEWNFQSADLKDVGSFSKCTINYYGLRVDANSNGNFSKSTNDGVKLATNGRIRVPVSKDARSKVTVSAVNTDSAKYTFDGATPSTTGGTTSFICTGKEYGEIVATGACQFKLIKVEEIEKVEVAGTITGLDSEATGLKVKFEDTKDSSNFAEGDVASDGSYSVELYVGSTYKISLNDPAYKLKTSEIAITEAKSDLDIATESLDVTPINGDITFQDCDAPEDFKLIFVSNDADKLTPEVTINEDNTYDVSLKNGATYNITLGGKRVADYDYSPKTLTADAENTAITITKAATNTVNVNVDSYDGKEDVTYSKIKFTRENESANEEVYDYTFNKGEDIALRDGTYSVEVTGVSYPYQFDASEKLTVNGAATDYSLKFKERFVWDFSVGLTRDPMLTQVTWQTGNEKNDKTFYDEDLGFANYQGLLVNTGTAGKFGVTIGDSVQVNSGTTIKIPVSGTGTLELTVKGTDHNITGGTLKETTDATTANYKLQKWEYDSDEYITLQSTGSIYIRKIKVIPDPEKPNVSESSQATGSTESESATSAETGSESSTEAGSKPSTESGSDVSTEGSSDVSTEGSSNPSTEGSSDASTEGASDPSTENASDPSTEGESEPPTDPAGDESPYGQKVELPAFEAGNKLEVDKKYGIDGLAEITVMDDMYVDSGKQDDDGNYLLGEETEANKISIDGKDYYHFFQGSANGSDPISTKNGGQDIIESGTGYSNVAPSGTVAAFKIVPAKNTKITFFVKQNGKNYYFVDEQNLDDISQNVPLGQQTAGGAVRQFTMRAGHTYYFFAGGSKVMVAEIYLKEISESELPSIGESGDSNESNEANESKPAESGATGETSKTPETSETTKSSDVIIIEEESLPEEADAEESKIQADPAAADGVVYLSDSRKITVTAADLVVGSKPAYRVTVTYTNANGKRQELVEGIHYTAALASTSPTKDTTGKTAGDYRITVSAITDKDGNPVKTDLGTFKGSKTVSYKMIDKKAADKTKDITKVKGIGFVKGADKNLSYTGTYVTPEITVPGLTPGTHYTVVYKNNVNAGKASATVIGLAPYYGQKEFKFTIKPRNIADKAVTMALDSTNASIKKGAKAYEATGKTDAALKYKGKAITLNGLTVELPKDLIKAEKNLPLKQGIDYTVTYKKNTTAGTATAAIKGMNNFSGAINVNYTIAAEKIDASSFEGATVTAEATTKGAVVSTIKLKSGLTLKAGTDFKADNKGLKDVEVGKTGSATVTGTGSYKKMFDKVTVSATVEKGSFHIKDNAVVDITKIAVTDKAKLVAAAKITDASGAKVKATDIKTITPVGNTALKVEPTDAAKFETTTLTCHVAKKLSGIAKAKKINKNDSKAIQKFDGVNNVTLTTDQIVEIYLDANGVEAKDIRIVSYKNNNKIGSATVVIEGRNNSPYYGTMNVKFTIAAAKPTLETGAEDAGDNESGSFVYEEESSQAQETNDTGDTSGSGEKPGTGESSGAETKQYVLEAGSITLPPTYADGDEVKAGTDDAFTLILKALNDEGKNGTLIETKNVTWTDGYTGTKAINFGGKGQKTKGAVKFETTGKTTVKIWWMAGGDDRYMAIFDDNTTVEKATIVTETAKGSVPTISTVEIPSAGTWYLGGSGNNYLFKVQIGTGTEGGGETNPSGPETNPSEPETNPTNPSEPSGPDKPVTGGVLLELDLTDVAAEKDRTSDLVIGDFTVKATAETNSSGKLSQCITVEATKEPVEFDDGTTFTKRLKLGGTGAAGYRSIHFTAPAAGTLVVYVQQGSSDSSEDRPLGLFKKDGAEVESQVVHKGEVKEILNYTVPAAGDYYIASKKSGAAIYGIKLIGEGGSETDPSEPETGDSTESSDVEGSKTESSDVEGSKTESSDVEGSKTPESSEAENSKTPESSEAEGSKTPESSDVSGTEAGEDDTDTKKVERAKTAVENALENFAITADTEADAIKTAMEQALSTANIDGVEVTVTIASKKAATLTEDGYFIATIKLTCKDAENAVTADAQVDINKVFAAEGTAAQKVAAAKEKVAAVVGENNTENPIGVNNDTTKAILLQAIIDRVYVATDVKLDILDANFNKTPASGNVDGSIIGKVTITCGAGEGAASDEVEFNFTIIATGTATPNEDQEKVANAKKAIDEADFSSAEVTNGTDRAGFIAKIKEVVTSLNDVELEIAEDDDSFKVTKAHNADPGKIEAVVTIKSNAESATVTVTIEIPQLEEWSKVTAAVAAITAAVDADAENPIILTASGKQDVIDAIIKDNETLDDGSISLSIDSDLTVVAAAGMEYGKVSGTLTVKCGDDASDTLPFELKLDKTEQAKAVEDVTDKIQTALNAMTVDSTTEQSAIETEITTVLTDINDVSATVKEFTNEDSKITVTITISHTDTESGATTDVTIELPYDGTPET